MSYPPNPGRPSSFALCFGFGAATGSFTAGHLRPVSTLPHPGRANVGGVSLSVSPTHICANAARDSGWAGGSDPVAAPADHAPRVVAGRHRKRKLLLLSDRGAERAAICVRAAVCRCACEATEGSSGGVREAQKSPRGESGCRCGRSDLRRRTSGE